MDRDDLLRVESKEEYEAFGEEDLALRPDSDCILGSAGKILERTTEYERLLSRTQVTLRQSTLEVFPVSG